MSPNGTNSVRVQTTTITRLFKMHDTNHAQINYQIQNFTLLNNLLIDLVYFFCLGTMNGIVQTFGYELMFLVIKVYPSFVSTFGIECIWTGFASGCLLCALYGAFIMPETKGKTIDDILKSFEARQKSIKNNLP